MDKSQAVAFLRRWSRVNKYEKKELQKTSFEKKIIQLSVLMNSVKEFNWDDLLKAEEYDAYSRWNKLRRLASG